MPKNNFPPTVLVVIVLSSFFWPTKAEHDTYDVKLKKLEELFAKVPTEKLVQVLFEEEKIKLVKNLANSGDVSQEDSQNYSDYFDEYRLPKQLTKDETDKDIEARIKAKYVGELPSQIKDVIFYFDNHKNCLENKIGIYNRILLHGNPGTGKSHLVKVLAQELQVPIFIFSASAFADKYIGESSRKIRKVFSAAKKLNRPVFIFIDEIDALAAKRTDSMHSEHRATLITLLTELQELQEDKNIFIFAATNDLQVLDQAVKDRFAGSVCEIKDLNIDQRAQLFLKNFSDKGVSVDPYFARRLAEVIDTTYTEKDSSIKKPSFSNRDIEYIVTSIILKQFAACKKDNSRCKDHLCKYARQAIDATGKSVAYAKIMDSFCDGI